MNKCKSIKGTMFKKGGTDGATFRQLQDAFNYNTLPPPAIPQYVT